MCKEFATLCLILALDMLPFPFSSSRSSFAQRKRSPVPTYRSSELLVKSPSEGSFSSKKKKKKIFSKVPGQRYPQSDLAL